MALRFLKSLILFLLYNKKKKKKLNNYTSGLFVIFLSMRFLNDEWLKIIQLISKWTKFSKDTNDTIKAWNCYYNYLILNYASQLYITMKVILKSLFLLHQYHIAIFHCVKLLYWKQQYQIIFIGFDMIYFVIHTHLNLELANTSR